MVKRIEPKERYEEMPCSYVAVGCAYEKFYQKPFTQPLPKELKDSGYLTTAAMNKYIRGHLPVRKKIHYNRGTRPTLGEILEGNTSRCIICVYGHFLYAEYNQYWSFLDNEMDDVVDIWYLEDKV